MIKTNIKMRVTPEKSRRVQEICFENGIEWQDSKKTLQEYKYIIIRKDYLTTCSDIKHYNEYVEKEISADLFIKTNGTCEETTNTAEDRYCKSIMNFAKASEESDNILLKKKIENLHIALKKKIEKNKNQALEITKLLEQKKAIKYDINIAINHLLEMKELKEENSFVKSEHNQILERLNQSRTDNAVLTDSNYKLKKQLREKDAIISYLESKLK